MKEIVNMYDLIELLNEVEFEYEYENGTLEFILGNDDVTIKSDDIEDIIYYMDIVANW